jgi:hypothetical protein
LLLIDEAGVSSSVGQGVSRNERTFGSRNQSAESAQSPFTLSPQTLALMNNEFVLE